MIVHGIDTASAGCAARATVKVVDGVARIVEWRAIRRSRRRSTPWDYADPIDSAQIADDWTAHCVLTAGVSGLVVVGATHPFVRPRSAAGQTGVSPADQAEAAGAIVQACGVACVRVASAVWRPLVLRRAGTDPSCEHAAAIAWGLAAGQRDPLTWQAAPLPRYLPEWAVPHVAEAACLAMFGFLATKAGDVLDAGINTASNMAAPHKAAGAYFAR